MPRILNNERLIRVTQAKNVVIKNWEEGISLQRDSRRSIPQLISNAAVDRWRLAYEHRHNANKLLGLATPLYRGAVSRYYYSMYHAVRACVYIHHRGDDHEKHSILPMHLPPDFDPTVNWQNKLKSARETRNSADYDPYPKSNLAWRKSALELKDDADQLLASSKTYLQNKGCIL